MRNPYDVLGVTPTASEADIRKVFRKLAKQYHPDLNQNDPAAEIRFKEINGAYDLLSDAKKRARFDRGEIDAAGNETYAHAAGGFGGGGAYGGFSGANPFHGAREFRFSHDEGEDVGSIFSHLFGDQGGFSGATRSRPRDHRHRLSVDFLDAVNGAKRRITLPDGRSLDVAIPAGIEEGHVLRLKGQGEASGVGRTSGDLLLEIHIGTHKLFRRKDRDIHVDIPVTPNEAIAGARITVPTPSGAVTLTVPAGSNTGRVLRLKGRGVAAARDRAAGDLYVTLQVVLPDPADPELAAAIADWEGRHPYDPRRNL
jgi:DnaJ-class molecular chaperone